MDEQTVVTWEEQPPDDSDETWHVHTADEPSDWGWGINCDECRGESIGHLGVSTLPVFSIERLQQQNRDHITTAGQVREMLDGVKPEDRDKIARAK